jgi:hypothetical protein
MFSKCICDLVNEYAQETFQELFHRQMLPFANSGTILSISPQHHDVRCVCHICKRNHEIHFRILACPSYSTFLSNIEFDVRISRISSMEMIWKRTTLVEFCDVLLRGDLFSFFGYGHSCALNELQDKICYVILGSQRDGIIDEQMTF